MAKKKNIPTILDTSGKAYKLALKKKPFMIKPNLKETESALGIKLSSLSKIKQAAYKLQKSGIKIVAITQGSRGALVYNGKEMILATPAQLVRKSPVGCGDAFIGGFIASQIRKKKFSGICKAGYCLRRSQCLKHQPRIYQDRKRQKNPPTSKNSKFVKNYLFKNCCGEEHEYFLGFFRGLLMGRCNRRNTFFRHLLTH